MAENGSETSATTAANDSTESAKESSRLGVRETIFVPDDDLTETEVLRIARQIAKVANALGGNLMRHAALSRAENASGAGHPVCAAILNCAGQADNASAQLDMLMRQRAQIVPGTMAVVKGRPGRA